MSNPFADPQARSADAGVRAGKPGGGAVDAAAPSRAMTLARAILPAAVGIGMAWVLHRGIAPTINAYYCKVLTDIGIYMILAVSLNIVNGFTGQFSIGHGGFMSLGAYAAAAIVYYGSFMLWGSADIRRDAGGGELLFVSACLAGGVVAALAGLLVGLPSLRLRGDYLAIVTLGFGEITRVLLQRSGDLPLDADEIKAAPFFGVWQLFDGEQIRLFLSNGFDASKTTWQWPLFARLGGALGFTGLPYYANLFWVFSFVAITLVATFRLKQSSYGRAFLAIRENEIAAEAMGVPVTRFKVRAFVLSAFFAGIAGALFAHEDGTSLNAGELGFQKSFDIIIMVVLGGMGSISGAVLAAVILTVLPELLREPPHVWGLGLAILIVALIRGRHRVRSTVWIVGVTAALEWLRSTAIRNGINLAEYRMVLYALSLIVMMIVRPQGLFGVREVWEFWPFRASRREVRPCPVIT